jgi:hypothetical protein
MSEPPPAPEPQDARPGPAGRAEQQPQARERYGILTIERRLKDDGRALLLYARERHDD